MTKCVDPVAVNLSIESRGGTVQGSFTESGVLPVAGSGNVTVGMRRNASHLLFQVIN